MRTQLQERAHCELKDQKSIQEKEVFKEELNFNWWHIGSRMEAYHFM